MEIDDKDLQRSYREYVMGKIPSTRKNCPSTKEIINFFKTKLSEKHKTEIVDHITNCSYCLKEFDFILQTLRYEETLCKEVRNYILSKTEKDASTKKLRKKTFSFIRKIKNTLYPHFSWRYALLFLGAIIIILSFVVLLDKYYFKQLRTPEDRGKGILSINLIEPTKGVYSRSELIFKWNEIKDSDYYLLELFDEALLPLWKSQKIFKSQFTLPSEILEKLIKNKSYFWMVTVCFRDGKQLESNIEKFSLKD